MGNVLKINLLFRERFWENVKVWDDAGDAASFDDAGFFHHPEAALPTWWTQLPIRAPLLVGWAGGPRTDRLTAAGIPAGEGPASEKKDQKERLIELAVDSLADIFNLPPAEIRKQLEAYYLHDWRNDRFTLGAYSYVPVNGLQAQKVLAQPLGHTLYFAGEATSEGHIGTVHGAIQTGQRAAREILGEAGGS
jgi:hypothetical protein